MAEQKLPDVFAEPGVEDFIRAACLTALPGGGRAIDIHALTCDEEIIALFARRRRRLSLLDDVQHLHDVGARALQPGLI